MGRTYRGGWHQKYFTNNRTHQPLQLMRSFRKSHQFKGQYRDLKNFLPNHLRGEARIWLITHANLIKTFEEFDEHKFYKGRDIVNVFCPQIIISIKDFQISSLEDNRSQISCINENDSTHKMKSYDFTPGQEIIDYNEQWLYGNSIC